MISKNLRAAAWCATVFFAAATVAAQASNPLTHQNKPSAAVPATASPASNPAQPGAPNTTNPEQGTPGGRTECEGGSCDATPPHITIATPAPAPAPWPWQERIRWVADMLLVLIAYFGIMLGVSALRKIERQTRDAEATAHAAADTAKTALLYAQSQAQSERPWLLVSPEPVPGTPDAFVVVATNRGRSPARIVSFSDGIIFAADEARMHNAPTYKSGEPRAPVAAMILLPGESTEVKAFRRDDVKVVCESPEQLRRVEEWSEKIYLYGVVTYVDLRFPDEKQSHETAWCCWYIHGRQKSGMVMAGTQEYNHHT